MCSERRLRREGLPSSLTSIHHILIRNTAPDEPLRPPRARHQVHTIIVHCPHHSQHLLPREEPDIRPQRQSDMCNANSPSSRRIHPTSPLCLSPRVCLVVVERDELGFNTILPVQVSSHGFRRDHMACVDKVLIRVAALDADARLVWSL